MIHEKKGATRGVRSCGGPPVPSSILTELRECRIVVLVGEREVLDGLRIFSLGASSSAVSGVEEEGGGIGGNNAHKIYKFL